MQHFMNAGDIRRLAVRDSDLPTVVGFYCDVPGFKRIPRHGGPVSPEAGLVIQQGNVAA